MIPEPVAQGSDVAARRGRPIGARETGRIGTVRGRMRDDGRTMTVFLVLLIPLLLMVFALFMERVEKRLKTSTVSEADVQEFLDTARPEEVNTLIREGWSRRSPSSGSAGGPGSGASTRTDRLRRSDL